jgi:arsenate reductase-like glutaredoxin family protein
VTIGEQGDAKKERFDREASLRLARQASEIYVAKGKSVVHLDLKESQPSDDELARLLLGPSGTLRAPAMRVGTTLLIGFEPGAYEKVLGARG